MADKDIVAAVKKRDLERAAEFERIAFGGAPTDSERACLAEGLDFLVKDYREVAELLLQAKLRGGKAQADDRRTVAAALALLAVELRKPGAKTEHAESRRPEKRCGQVEQHEAHSWTEWSGDASSEQGQTGETFGCPGWPTPPRDMSGLRALIAERGPAAHLASVGLVSAALGSSIKAAMGAEADAQHARVVDVTTGAGGVKATEIEPVTLAPGAHVAAMPIDPKPGDTIMFMFDEPPAIEDGSGDLARHGGPSGAFGSAVLDEPPPPGQSVALAGEVFTWGKLRGISNAVRAETMSQSALGLPEHVSHSQISTFAECALKGLLTRSETLGVQQLPQWANVGGTAVHLAIERFERMVHEVRQLQYVKDRLHVAGGIGKWWNEAFRDTVAEVAAEHPWAPVETWRASKKGVENYTWWLVEGEAMLTRYITRRVEELESPWRRIRMADFEDEETKTYGVRPMIEHEFTLNVEGVPFKGVIDQVWEITGDSASVGLAAGDLLVDDLKSGSTPNDEAQLREYALWLDQQEPGARRRIWGRFIDVRRGEITSAPFILLVDPAAPAAAIDAWDELAFKVEHTAAVKAAGSFMPRENNYCVSCSVKHACPIMAAKVTR